MTMKDGKSSDGLRARLRLVSIRECVNINIYIDLDGLGMLNEWMRTVGLRSVEILWLMVKSGPEPGCER